MTASGKDGSRIQSLDGLRAISIVLVLLGHLAVCIDRWVHFPPDAVARFLNLGPVRKLGVMSYSLYLWQQIFFNRNQHSAWTAFPLNLMLALACAWVTHEAIEKPSLRLRQRWERKWKPKAKPDWEGAAMVSDVVAG